MREKKWYLADGLPGNVLFLPQSAWNFRIAALICSVFLSLLCSLFYNLWKYEIERIQQEKGGWQSQITGEISPEEIESIKNFAHVNYVVVKENEEGGGEKGKKEVVLEIYFDHMGAVLEETHLILAMLGTFPEEAQGSFPWIEAFPEESARTGRTVEGFTGRVSYNDELLAMYLVRSPQDKAPRLIFPMFILIMAMASGSLIMIIHYSFAVSMHNQLHQMGLFSSIGATPKQIRRCLLREVFLLCALPVFGGNLLGLFSSMGLLHLSNKLLGNGIIGRHRAVFGCHPLVLGLSLLITVLTIGILAWMPAWKLSRMTPLEAIRNTEELKLKRRKNSHILLLLFGVEGELAGNALKAQKKALRTASLSLILSFLAFTMMQCFFTLSEISTRETYFERYQDVWDIMFTVKTQRQLGGLSSGIPSAPGGSDKIHSIRQLPGVEGAAAYQKVMAKGWIREEELSEEMKGFGGFSHADKEQVVEMEKGWLVNVPLIILDDKSFLEYCAQIGIAPRLDGAVVRNQIRDVTNPDFRHPQYMPYVKGESEARVLFSLNGGNAGNAQEDEMEINKEIMDRERIDGGMTDGEKMDREMTDREKMDKGMMNGERMGRKGVEIPVLSYTTEVPCLREEYASLDYYELVHFIPAALWEGIKGQFGEGEEVSYLRILAEEGASPEEVKALQQEMEQIIGLDNVLASENRIEEYELNNRKIQGMKVVFGSFCVLLALIGIGNVFSNTLGFVRLRKREFARYRSIGMTSAGLKKMFCVEAMVIAGRPVLAALFLSVFAVAYMLKKSYLAVDEFLAEVPFVSVGGFMLVILGAVALAYFLAWRMMEGISLAEVLQDDTMLG